MARAPWRWLTLDYELRVPGGSHPFFGITFDAAADQITGIHWLGRGPYRVWKNRLDGQGFDVWASTSNDTVTGESWEYPEFRGFFADLFLGDDRHAKPADQRRGRDARPVPEAADPAQPNDPRFTAVAFPEGTSRSCTRSRRSARSSMQRRGRPESQLNLVNGRTGTYTGTLHFAFGRADLK